MLVIRVDGRPTAEDVENYMVRHAELFSGKGRFASLVDLAALKVPELGAIKRYARDESEHNLESLMVASAYVAPTPALRGLLGFVNRIKPPVIPTLVATTVGDAEAFCEQHLQEAGLEVPPRAAVLG